MPRSSSLVALLVTVACGPHTRVASTAAIAPAASATASASARCGKPGWQHDASLPRVASASDAFPRPAFSFEDARAGLSAPSRWVREETLDRLRFAGSDLPALVALLEASSATDASSYVRSESARLIREIRELASGGPRHAPSWTRSYVGLWDARPEPLAAVVAPVRQRSVPAPSGYFEAFGTSACFRFPEDTEATLQTPYGSLVGASYGEFGCLSVLYEPGRPPRPLPLCGTVFFEINKVLYGIYRLDHMDGTNELERATRRADGSFAHASLSLPDTPHGAYALADGTLLIDTGEAAVHVDGEGIASVRPRQAVVGLPAGPTEGFDGAR